MTTPYRLLSYEDGSARGRAGMLIGESVFDVATVLDAAKLASPTLFNTVEEVLEEWDDAHRLIKTAAASIGSDPIVRAVGRPLAGLKLKAPVTCPGAVFASGGNYTDHLEEMAAVLGLAAPPTSQVTNRLPWHFMKSSRGSVVGHGVEVRLPAYAKQVDWEVELAAVIGRTASGVSPEHALDYVAGYTVANDLSARDHVKRACEDDGSPFKFDWISQKCFTGSCPLGPWITPAAFIGEPQALGIRLWVNERIKQDSRTSRMISSVAEQVAFLSTRLTLYPGDVILTGTPAGVGMATREFLRPGDRVRAWIENIGSLETRIAG